MFILDFGQGCLRVDEKGRRSNDKGRKSEESGEGLHCLRMSLAGVVGLWQVADVSSLPRGSHVSEGAVRIRPSCCGITIASESRHFYE